MTVNLQEPYRRPSLSKRFNFLFSQDQTKKSLILQVCWSITSHNSLSLHAFLYKKLFLLKSNRVWCGVIRRQLKELHLTMMCLRKSRQTNSKHFGNSFWEQMHQISTTYFPISKWSKVEKFPFDEFPPKKLLFTPQLLDQSNVYGLNYRFWIQL